jgi:hypothetical protein
VAEDRIYLDHGYTGKNRSRPGLDQALAVSRPTVYRTLEREPTSQTRSPWRSEKNYTS